MPRPRLWPGGARGAASVTFDGGYASAVDRAVPVLESLAVPSTWYLVAGSVGGTLEERAVAPWSTWSDLVSTGLVEVGSHSLTHPRVRPPLGELGSLVREPRTVARLARDRLDQLVGPPRTVNRWRPPRAVTRDAIAGCEVIEWQLGRTVESYAYPNGGYRPQISRALGRLGVVAARTTSDGTNPPHPQLFDLQSHVWTTSTDIATANQSLGPNDDWVIDVHHLVQDDGSYQWTTSTGDFKDRLGALVDSGRWIATVADVGKWIRSRDALTLKRTFGDDAGPCLAGFDVRGGRTVPVEVEMSVPRDVERVTVTIDRAGERTRQVAEVVDGTTSWLIHEDAHRMEVGTC